MSRLWQLSNGASRRKRFGVAWAAAAVSGLIAGQASAGGVSTYVAQATTFHAAGPGKAAGTVNLSILGAEAARSSGAGAAVPTPRQLKNLKDFRDGRQHTFRPPHTFNQAEAAVGAPHATLIGQIVDRSGQRVTDDVSGNSFNGLDHADQRNADNGNQISAEPSSPALAVGHGYVLEAVNNALQVYKPNGKPLLAAPVSMNKFFNLVSEFNSVTGEQGPFLSDPRAFYDWTNGRFIVTEWATLNNGSGVPLNISLQFVAVSQTSDPTGGWNIFSYDTTNVGTQGCPCFPDFGQLGMDANGVYISSNLFSIKTDTFVGAVIYALPKSRLIAGSIPYVQEASGLSDDFAIAPTVVPPDGKYAAEKNGTEYMVEGTAYFSGKGIGASVNIWAITNTLSLKGNRPSLGLDETFADTQTVSANLPPAVQKDGPRPLGGPGGFNDPVPLLDPGDGRFASPPFYVDGVISAVSSTAVVQPDNSVGDGVAFYQFTVKNNEAQGLTASVKDQAIFSAPDDAFLTYPVLAINSLGEGAIGVSISGKNRFPSTATIAAPEFVKPRIVLSGRGAQPDDGFTAYTQEGGNGVGHWGDYGAAAVDRDGVLWFDGEYIPDSALYPRTALANWGTYITRTSP
jgi:hypothetical protein